MADTGVASGTRALVERFHSVKTEYEAVTAATQELRDRVGADSTAVFGVEDGAFVCRAVWTRHLHGGPRRSVEEGVVGRAYRDSEPVLVADTAAEPDAAPTGPYRSVLAVPAGEAVLVGLDEEAGAFDSAALATAELIATVLSGALDRIRATAEAARERDRFAALFDTVPDPALQYRLDHGRPRIVEVNTAFVSTFGYEPDAVVGEYVDDVLVPESGDCAPPETTPDTSDSDDDREVTRLTVEGPSPFLLRRVPIDADSGYYIYTDIADLKERERRLERQNERLERFASVVSHDLRNPLNLARGYVDLAKDGDPGDNLAKVESAHERIDAIIEDVLAMAREGDAVTDSSPVRIDDLAEDAWNLIDAVDVTLRVGTDAEIEADRERLRRAFENLFRNAVEHGGDVSTIYVRSTADGFAVDDDGRGILAAELEQVFDPGHSIARSGTGLGLSIVREIARAHDWDVVARESPEGGARIEFLLDATEPDSAFGDRSPAELG